MLSSHLQNHKFCLKMQMGLCLAHLSIIQSADNVMNVVTKTSNLSQALSYKMLMLQHLYCKTTHKFNYTSFAIIIFQSTTAITLTTVQKYSVLLKLILQVDIALSDIAVTVKHINTTLAVKSSHKTIHKDAPTLLHQHSTVVTYSSMGIIYMQMQKCI